MKVCLQQWEPKDAAVLAAMADNRKIADNLRDSFPFPYCLEDAVSYIHFTRNVEPKNELHLAVMADGVPVGSISIILDRRPNSCKNAELGYWLGEQYWGNGIIPQAIKEICKIGFAQYRLERIFAEVFEYNNASCRVLEKCGFTLEGTLRKSTVKNGRVFNAYLYSILKDEFNDR